MIKNGVTLRFKGLIPKPRDLATKSIIPPEFYEEFRRNGLYCRDGF